MNILRTISTISTIMIIALATQFVFMLTDPTPALARGTRCPCAYIKNFILDHRLANRIGAQLQFDTCFETDELINIVNREISDACSPASYLVATLASDFCFGEAFCCKSQVECPTANPSSYQTLAIVAPISTEEHAACTRELNLLVWFLDLTCGPP